MSKHTDRKRQQNEKQGAMNLPNSQKTMHKMAIVMWGMFEIFKSQIHYINCQYLWDTTPISVSLLLSLCIYLYTLIHNSVRSYAIGKNLCLASG